MQCNLLPNIFFFSMVSFFSHLFILQEGSPMCLWMYFSHALHTILHEVTVIPDTSVNQDNIVMFHLPAEQYRLVTDAVSHKQHSLFFSIYIIIIIITIIILFSQVVQFRRLNLCRVIHLLLNFLY